MIVSFEFYVMNFVDFVVDCYSHITSHVSQAFVSCTHNTSYSLLNIVHVIMCVFGLTNQVWKILWVLCKTDLLLKKREIVWYLNFWENWVLNLGFVKIISSHTHAFFFFNALRKGYIKFFWFSKIHFFYNFDQSSLFFDQSNIMNKVFLKTQIWLVHLLFQNFFKLSSFFPTWQGFTEDFLSFSTKFFTRFFSP